MSHNNTKKYIDVLPDIIESYNNSSHRGLGNEQTPNQVHVLTTPSDIKRQFDIMYKYPLRTTPDISSNLTVGQVVRIADEKRNWVFRRGYTVQNTLEIFRIKEVNKEHIPTVFYLEDLQGEAIKGIFYREELVPTNLPEFFPIDVIKTKTVAGRKKYLVRWRGYPSTFNSWIDQDQIQPL